MVKDLINLLEHFEICDDLPSFLFSQVFLLTLKFQSQSTHLYLLFESASGYALFENIEAQEIGSELDAVQKSMQDISKYIFYM
jgi:hypothetical protein